VPGDDAAELSFRAEYPGLFTYHCAVPAMDHHVSSGMFGAILVEPEAGLPAVDRELYLGQHELYTKGDLGEKGHHAFDHGAMLAEDPTYVVFNGVDHGFTEDRLGPIGGAEVGETAVRVLRERRAEPVQLVAPDRQRLVAAVPRRRPRIAAQPVRRDHTGRTGHGDGRGDGPRGSGPDQDRRPRARAPGRRGALAVVNVDGEPNPDVYDPGTDE